MYEKDIERKLVNLVKKRGGLAFKFVSPGNPGAPDRLIITPRGSVWFVELKTEKGRVGKLQSRLLAELERRGANVRIIRGLKEAEDFVKEVMQNDF